MIAAATIAPAVAHAEPGKVLFVHPASDAPEPLIDHALAVASDQIARTGQQALPVQDSACDLACAVGRLDAAHADLAMQLELWVPRGFRREGAVAVTLKDSRGSSVGRAPLASPTPDAVARAVQVCLERSLSNWPSRGGVLVRIEGSPAGASVVVDHDPETGGVLPIELRLGPGDHDLSASQYGYVDGHRRVTVPSEADQPIVVRLDLRPLPAPGRRDGQTWTHWAGASALLAAGIAGVSLGALSMLRDGACTERASSGVCVSRKEASHATALTYLITGGAAVAGAGAWATWTYLRVSPRGGEVGVQVPLGRQSKSRSNTGIFAANSDRSRRGYAAPGVHGGFDTELLDR